MSKTETFKAPKKEVIKAVRVFQDIHINGSHKAFLISDQFKLEWHDKGILVDGKKIICQVNIMFIDVEIV